MGLDYKRTLSPKTMLNELKSVRFWHDLIVEGISCTYLMITVILVLITSNPDTYTPGVTHFGLFAGFLLFIIIEGYGPVGGAVINPAAAFALCLSGHTTPLRMLACMLSQLGGYVAGTWIGYGLIPVSKRDNFPALQPADALSDVQCVMIEACLAFNTMFVGLSVSDYTNKPAARHGLPALSAAFCCGVGILCAGTQTGGLQNPLVPLGPSILNGKWVRHWIYWVGPFLGMSVGAMTYELSQLIRKRFPLELIPDETGMSDLCKNSTNIYRIESSDEKNPEPLIHCD